MIRVAIALGLALVALASGASNASGAGDPIQVRDAGDAIFPERSYVLTLPERRELRTNDVTVTENGERVVEVRVEKGAASATGVVLAIDASESMHGRSIEDAMAAARAFARNRRPEQKLGVVFFSREATVALEPTVDAAAIERLLDAPPPLTKGTQIYDATKMAIDLVEKSGVAAGTVVLLSDGADAGSTLDARSIAAAAKASKVAVHAVGLQSASYEPTAMRSITANGGRYLESATSQGLEAIFAELGREFGNEYLVRWTSLAPVGSRVGIGFEVAGFPGFVTAAYQVPDLRVGGNPAPATEESFWRSTLAAVIVALVVAILVGTALTLLIRQRRKSVGERIASFVFERRENLLPRLDREGPTPFERLANSLRGRRLWDAYELDVELARLKPSPMQLVAATVAGTLLVAAVSWLLGRPVVALIALVVIPVIARLVVKRLADNVRKRFGEQLPDNLQVMASALRAGHSFVGALQSMVDDAPEPSRSEYSKVLTDEQLGVPIEDSLNVVAARMKNEEVAYVGLIATLQRETGGNTAEVLDRVVITIRERMKLRRMIRTLTAQGRLGGWIVTALPIAMVVFLNVVQPSYMDPMTETTLGWVILGLGAVMVAAGAFVIRKIVDIQV